MTGRVRWGRTGGGRCRTGGCWSGTTNGGCGLSDWAVDASSFTLDAWVRDLEAIVDTLGLDRFPLLGVSQGGPIALTYAARHPERVSHLIIYGTCTRSVWARATPTERRAIAALAELIRVSWGSD